jgi:hypothetical protein
VILTSGLRLTVLAGRSVPVPLPIDLIERLRSVTVTESDEARSAFSLVLDAPKPGAATAFADPFGATSPLAAFSRVVLVVTFGPTPQVLFDGIITETKVDPAQGGGASTVTITGEDVGNLLDRVERDVEHPALDDYVVVLTILGTYAPQGLVAMALPPPTLNPPLPIDRIPTQHGTDLKHLSDLAERHGYVTYVIPGPAPGVSAVYWGPPVRVGLPQPALAADLGADTNVTEVSFRTEATTPTTITGAVADRTTGSQTPVVAPASTRPPLAAAPFATANAGDIQSRRLRDAGSDTVSAQARAQAQVDLASDAVVAEGKADGARYGSVLRARGIVGMRGAGWSYDGLWYVRKVEHELAMGRYELGFTLAREGHGALTPVLPRAAA